MGNPVFDFLGGLVTDGKGNVDPTKVAAGLAALTGLYGATNRDSSVGEFMFGRPQQPVGYMGGIPEYNVARSLAPNAFATTTPTGEPRRPGSGGRRYFTDTTYTPTGKTMAGATPSQGVYNALTATQANELFKRLFGTGGLGGTTTDATTGGTTGGTEGFGFGDGSLDMALRETPEQRAAKNAFIKDFHKITGGTTTGDTTGGTTTGDTTGGTTTGGTTTGGTTGGTTGATTDAAKAAAAYNTFVSGLYNKTLSQEDLKKLIDSGYDLNKIATDLKISGGGAAITSAYNTNVQNAAARAKAIQDAADAAKAKAIQDAADAAKAADPYNILINQYLGGKTLTDKDFLTLRSSGYDVNKLATDLGIKPVGTATGADRLTGATQRAEANAADTVADQIRQGKYTPATAATKLNELYPGYKMSEEAVVFELLNRGETTPQEVAKYYADRGYAPEEVLARYKELGGTRTFAQGGLASLPQSRGYYLGGATDGMADEIPATIENTEPAALSDGEFVIPADVVSHLGNGNSDAGARQLYAMMDRIRQARTGRKEQGRNINPNKYLPT